jgi:hypothetical protein
MAISRVAWLQSLQAFFCQPGLCHDRRDRFELLNGSDFRVDWTTTGDHENVLSEGQ